MRFLILGASGFLGSCLGRLLDRHGIPWSGTARAPQRPGLIPFDLAHQHVKPHLLAQYWEEQEETCVVHAVSFGSIDACALQRGESWAVNVAGSQRVIESLRPYRVRHVFLSTNQVFDGSKLHYREGDLPQPLNEYGRQKVAVEQFLLERSPQSLVLRLDKVVSDQPDDGQWLGQWWRTARAGQSLRCLPGQRLAPTLVGDVATAILLACQRRLSGVYHVANPEVFERRELAEMFLDVMALPGTITMVSEAELGLVEPRPRAAILDSSKFLAATGMAFTPMRRVLEEFRRRASPAK